jgi:hypothetical protein
MKLTDTIVAIEKHDVRMKLKESEAPSATMVYCWEINPYLEVEHTCIPHPDNFGYDVTSVFTKGKASTEINWKLDASLNIVAEPHQHKENA